MTHEGLRRTLHAISFLFVLVAIYGSAELLRVVLIAVSIFAITADVLRLKIPKLGAAVARFIPMFREREGKSFSGAMWLSLGYMAASLFSTPASICGIVVGALSDPAASLVGSRYGDPDKKTWIGSTAAVIVAFVVLLLTGIPWPAVVSGAVTATILERWSGPINDNLVIAPGTALIVWLMI